MVVSKIRVMKGRRKKRTNITQMKGRRKRTNIAQMKGRRKRTKVAQMKERRKRNNVAQITLMMTKKAQLKRKNCVTLLLQEKTVTETKHHGLDKSNTIVMN